MQNQSAIFTSAVCLLLAVACCSCSVGKSTAVPGPVDSEVAPAFSSTDSGLKYRILRASDGAKPSANDSVTVHYVGTLEDGSEFDSSYKRGEPATFGLRNVVAGWTEGLQLVGEGGMIELEVPPDLGYGMRGAPGAIPPNATLNFKVELIKIN